MERTTTWTASQATARTSRAHLTRRISTGALAAALALVSQASLADEGGVSFWIPGFFGSLAATPQQPGWSLVNMYYHTTVSAGADVSRAREITIGKIPANLSANLSANLNATGDIGIVIPSYVFATPVLGGQLAVGAIASYGRASTSLAGTLTGALTLPGFGSIPFGPRSDSISDSVWGFGDLLPLASLRWNNGVHNVHDLHDWRYPGRRLRLRPAVESRHRARRARRRRRLHLFQSGDRARILGVLGFTYNFENQSTQYQNGVDMHLDWGASQFLTKQFQIGLVGYVYKELGCDSGSGDRVGCFQSQVVGVGPQLGFIFPVGEMQGYINFKGYKEFAAENRPDGWNTWVTFVISPAAPTPSAPRRMVMK